MKKVVAGGRQRQLPLARSPKHLEFPCHEFQQGEEKLYIFACPAKTLWDIVEVNRKVEDKDEGYQRVLSEPRARKLAAWVDAGELLPLSLLVSFDSGEYIPNKGVLRIPNKPDAGWVIDGQHRLAGAHLAENDIALPVVAFIELELKDQVNSFVTINREQKGVPSSLYFELLKHLPGTRSDAQIAQQRAVEIADELKTDDSSPFFGRIVATTAPKRGQLSLTNFVRKVTPLVRPNGTLMAVNQPQRPSAIANYYKALAQVFPDQFDDDSIFFKTLGFGTLMNSFSTIFLATVAHKKRFKVADVVEMLRKIEDFDFSAWAGMGTGDKAERDAAANLIDHFQVAVNKDEATDGPIEF